MTPVPHGVTKVTVCILCPCWCRGLCCHWGHDVLWASTATMGHGWVHDPTEAKVCADVYGSWYHQRHWVLVPGVWASNCIHVGIQEPPCHTSHANSSGLHSHTGPGPDCCCRSCLDPLPNSSQCPVWCLWLVLPQEVIESMHVEIWGPCWANPVPHWPRDSWSCPLLDTAAEEVAPTPRRRTDFQERWSHHWLQVWETWPQWHESTRADSVPHL